MVLILDANNGYWHVETAEQDCHKTAFTSNQCLFGFTRMPFRLMNGTQTFKRSMDVLITKIKWQLALIYLEDIVISLPKPDEHKGHVDK